MHSSKKSKVNVFVHFRLIKNFTIIVLFARSLKKVLKYFSFLKKNSLLAIFFINILNKILGNMRINTVRYGLNNDLR